MKRILLIALMMASFSALAQEQEAAAGLGAVVITTHVYKDTLALDYYMGKSSDSLKKPLLVLVHGGGFSGGTRDGDDEQKFSREMASKGYDVASISYRLTRKESGFGCDCPARDKINTFLMASEDMMSAIEYMADNPNFDFDKESIFLVGSSAGAETVLTGAYMRDHYEFKSLQPFRFAGVVSLAGAVIDSDYITAQNAIPTLLVHGGKDQIVPFGSAPHHFCAPEDTGYICLDGSETIARRLDTLGTSYIFAADPEGTHDWANEGYELVDLIGQFIENVRAGVYFGQNRIRIQSN